MIELFDHCRVEMIRMLNSGRFAEVLVDQVRARFRWRVNSPMVILNKEPLIAARIAYVVADKRFNRIRHRIGQMLARARDQICELIIGVVKLVG